MSGEKQNENKFMAMLERRGIIRKAEPGEADSIETIENTASQDAINRDATGQNDDLRALLELSKKDTPGARRTPSQPVPGILKPLFSEDTEKPEAPEEDSPVETFKVKRSKDINDKEPDLTADIPQANAEQIPGTPEIPTREEPSEMHSENTNPVMPQEPADAGTPVYEVPVAEAAAGETQGSARDNLFAWIDNEKVSDEQPVAENYTERYLTIEELYEVLSLRSKKTDTIYLIEDYLKTIPDSLPDESRRQIVSQIVASSGFDFDLLMGDGILRVKMLKEYAEKFARYTEDYVAACQAELAELENQIVRIHKLIENRRELHKKQFLSIEAEAGRLREILTFISGS